MIKGGFNGSIECKRFYLPGIVYTDKCPKCGESVTIDFGDNYLSYPQVNTPIDAGGYCNKCDHGWEIPVVLSVTLKQVVK